MPNGFILPMMAAPVAELPQTADWSYEIKLDGFRCIASKGKDKARLYSRRGKSLTGRFPEIAECLTKHLPRDTILDGEIVALNDRGLPSFNLLQNDSGEIVFYAFDILIERGNS